MKLFDGEHQFKSIHHNPSVETLYEIATSHYGNHTSSRGALMAFSGKKTGRSPKDKRIVKDSITESDVDWGAVNIPFTTEGFQSNRKIALEHLNTRDEIFVIDGFAGWEPENQIKVRIICTLPYHALFMYNMLIRPTEEEFQHFGDPDWVVFNAGCTKADPSVPDVENETSVVMNFTAQEIVILGTQYAGEMKKGVFSVLNYVLPKKGVMAMHCSANAGADGDTALFFGLSGTGKTTLSADPDRDLIGDDEHGWSDKGIFNFEGGCYAKTVKLSEENEPEIYQAIRKGSILENVIYNAETMEVDYDDISITENTRCAYPIEFIPHAKIPCVGDHPSNIIFLTCDAFGVLPPVAKLNTGQAMYHFISGYTAKVAGTEQGVTEPQATFSACFGAAFLPLHPMRYAELLAKKVEEHGSKVWLVNTGWAGGPYGVGSRISLPHTRAIIHALLDHKIDDVEYTTDPRFGFAIPSEVPGVPPEILNPEQAWEDKAAYAEKADQLAEMFNNNFVKYEAEEDETVIAARPRTLANA
jgi:phosphoenolpyruvate carboxykinase (ATP)